MQSTNSFNLEKAKYKVEERDGGIEILAPVKDSRLVGTKRPDGSYRRQCGEYCNDAVGIPGYVGNTLASKVSRVTSNTPSPGSIGVLDTKTAYGHVLMVERVLDKERLVISESNYNDKELFRRIETTMTELRKRGLKGFTGGLDMTKPIPQPSIEAKEAWEKAKKKGMVSETTNPLGYMDSITIQHMLANVGVMQKPTGSGDKENQWFILALDRLQVFNNLPDKNNG